jgi:hypothetical protein
MFRWFSAKTIPLPKTRVVKLAEIPKAGGQEYEASPAQSCPLLAPNNGAITLSSPVSTWQLRVTGSLPK